MYLRCPIADERRGARELPRLPPRADGAAELGRVGRGEERVLEVRRRLVEAPGDVGAVPEVVLVRRELELIGTWLRGQGRGAPGERADREECERTTHRQIVQVGSARVNLPLRGPPARGAIDSTLVRARSRTGMA